MILHLKVFCSFFSIFLDLKLFIINQRLITLFILSLFILSFTCKTSVFLCKAFRPFQSLKIKYKSLNQSRRKNKVFKEDETL